MMMNALEQCYEFQFETKTWYFEQLTIIDLTYSHYIQKILQCKLSIKSKLEKEYKQRLQNIDEKIKLLTNINQLEDDNDNIESIKQEIIVKEEPLIGIDNNQLWANSTNNPSHDDQSISTSMKLNRVCSTANVSISLKPDTQANVGDDSENERQSQSETAAATELSEPKAKSKTLKNEEKNPSKSKGKSKKLMKNGKTLYKCIVCNEIYTNRGSANYHYIGKHTTRFECNFNNCNKCFPSDAHLKIHQRIHTGEKPHKCKFCEKRFRQSGQCSSHERRHTGEKPYKCEYCNKKFADISTRNVHETIHARGKQ